MNQLIKVFKGSNKDDFSLEVKEEDKTVYYPSSKAIEYGLEKSMA